MRTSVWYIIVILTISLSTTGLGYFRTYWKILNKMQ
jgi:hypothetical protein